MPAYTALERLGLTLKEMLRYARSREIGDAERFGDALYARVKYRTLSPQEEGYHLVATSSSSWERDESLCGMECVLDTLCGTDEGGSAGDLCYAFCITFGPAQGLDVPIYGERWTYRVPERRGEAGAGEREGQARTG